MSYQEKNITASFVVFTLILGFYLLRVFQLTQSDSFNLTNMVRLWGTVIVLGIVVTIVGTILTHIGSGIIEAIKTRQEPVISDIQDERDRLIDLRGTRITYVVYSLGVFLAMLTFALGQPALVMFSLLILAGLVGQIVGDISRLVLYRRGV
jgi:drug/metabolite transporter (DMT)-like permease